jgi:hypothetical protein
MCDDAQMALILSKIEAFEMTYQIRLVKNFNGLAFLGPNHEIGGCENLMRLYDILLASTKEDAPKEAILNNAYKTHSAVVETIELWQVVPWVNMVIIDYMRWYRSTLNVNTTTTYAEVVRFMDETIGQDAMRRIHKCLKQFKGDETAKVLCEYIDKYFETYTDEYTKVREFELSKTNMIKSIINKK